MPIILDNRTDRVCSLDEVLDYFSSIDVRNRERLLEGAETLTALANNRTFLAEVIVADLKKAKVQESNTYSSQVFWLGERKNFFMRANFWPARQDPAVKVNGGKTYFYGVPHDHNFDFMTVGYYGPGYGSDFYEYRYEDVAGYAGEKVDLKYVGRHYLPVGRVMLYRCSVDVHDQVPPESFSISVNVMIRQPDGTPPPNQYGFEIRDGMGMITRIVNRASLPLLCEAAGWIGDDECRELLDSISRTHLTPRGRYAAFNALAQLERSDAASVWERAAADPAKLVNLPARMRLRHMEMR